VPVGYGDGLARALKTKGRALIGGRALPFAGRIAMDLFMVDVTDLPGAAVGDEVVLIGTQGPARQTADDLAAAAGTINHEIITAIRRRVARRYHRGGKVVAHRTLVDGYVRI
jgi:alanine racemase